MQRKKPTVIKSTAPALKNHQEFMLNNLQLESINLNLVFIIVYLLMFIVKQTAARIKVLAAVVVCIGIAYSPLYPYMNNTQYYSSLSLIYIITCLNVKNKKVSATCCIMAIFEFTMVLDRYTNAGIETWLYIHFEEITFVIHSLIISAFFKWEFSRWWLFMGRIINHMCGLLRGVRDSSRLCYDKTNCKVNKT